MNEIINPPELGAPTGFSHAVRAGTTVYLAGQTGKGQDLAEQFADALSRLLTALRAAGGDPDDLVSLQVFVTDVPAYRGAVKELGQIWRRHCGRHYPAMGLFGVTELFEPEALVELMGVAVIDR
ncbi:MAG TPA: RidA family protein [Solirubrobacteraceae bacterium]|nr:RidA family protein [Solirubrobacteraceae bacterium]